MPSWSLFFFLHFLLFPFQCLQLCKDTQLRTRFIQIELPFTLQVSGMQDTIALSFPYHMIWFSLLYIRIFINSIFLFPISFHSIRFFVPFWWVSGWFRISLTFSCCIRQKFTKHSFTINERMFFCVNCVFYFLSIFWEV